MEIANPLPKRFIVPALILVAVIQVAVLVVEYLGSAWPIWYGQPVVLPTEPVDPRSLFRGNYVSLNFQINRLDRDWFPEARKNQVVFVSLEPSGDIWRASGIFAEPPEDQTFIRGRIRSVYQDTLRLEYGIEALFMPKDEALAAEKEARQVAWVTVYVGGSGKSRAHEFVCLGAGCGLDN